MTDTRRVKAGNAQELAQAVGLSGLEAREWEFQHSLLVRLRKIVKEAGLTHAEVARKAGSSRTRVTSILNGNLDQVSSDLLIRILGALGYRVQIRVTPVDFAA